ncbi:hypothetical protein [Sulfurimonas sp.]
MNDGLNVLKDLGAQRIHNDTHISKEYVQAIIHENFDGLNSVQFVGFISILEREYNVDLSELKAKGILYFEEITPISTEPKKVFVAPKRKKSYANVYIFLGAIIFLSFVYYTFIYLSSVTPNIEKIDNTKIENAQNNMRPVLELKNNVKFDDKNETNSTQEKIVVKENSNEKNIEPELKTEAKTIIPNERSLKIVPKNKVWAGYIEIETNKKYQKIFTEEHAIDTTKNWILLFGAGTVKLEVNGKLETFTSARNIRLKYLDGILSKISVEEFKSLNKGNKW